MYYPEAPCCGKDGISQTQEKILAINCDENELMMKISEIDFALTDLNLFLDTHPTNTEALELFKQLAGTLKSLVFDYEKKFGPLTARSSDDLRFFNWVSSDIKWPWQREGEV